MALGGTHATNLHPVHILWENTVHMTHTVYIIKEHSGYMLTRIRNQEYLTQTRTTLLQQTQQLIANNTTTNSPLTVVSINVSNF